MGLPCMIQLSSRYCIGRAVDSISLLSGGLAGLIREIFSYGIERDIVESVYRLPVSSCKARWIKRFLLRQPKADGFTGQPQIDNLLTSLRAPPTNRHLESDVESKNSQHHCLHPATAQHECYDDATATCLVLTYVNFCSCPLRLAQIGFASGGNEEGRQAIQPDGTRSGEGMGGVCHLVGMPVVAPSSCLALRRMGRQHHHT
jgi:hypothetical protein